MSNLFNYLTYPKQGAVSPAIDLFNTFFDGNFAPPASFSNDNIRFSESEAGQHIEIDLPGVKKEDLKVTFSEESHHIYVSAKRKITTKTGSKEESYTRSFVPGNDMNCSELTAKITDGVLNIDIPRKPRKEAKVINVQVG
jgi:HSP20 family protein